MVRKYCDTQISDGAWKSDSLRDHQGRLENIIEIIGDKEIHQVSREDMRRFRGVLEKLPPSRKKSPKYRSKSIDEILLMRYENVLSVKTINIIIQSISSMFEWAIREGFMSSNPARCLSKQDKEADIDKKQAFTEEEIR